ncbi:MAG: VanZ family protein [Sneathiella sp.]
MRRSRNLYMLGWLLLAVGIAVGSLMPIDAVPKAVSLVSDKIQHAGAYFCLGVLGWLGAKDRQGVIILFLLSFALGISIEFLQPLTGRHFEWADMVANTSGLIVAAFVGIYYIGRKATKGRI